MRTGFVILAHERLDRAAALAAHLADAGAGVVVHVDAPVPAAARAPLDALAARAGRVRVIATRRAEWGMIGLVEAALDGVRALGELDPALRHVCLLSGACLPVRPVAELEAFLAAHADTDFIESVPVARAPWVQGGLSGERFTLWFPVSWKRRRWLFDRLVDVQRALGVRRRVPRGLEPRLGLQWWCLSMATLRRVLEDARLPGWLRYFRRCWIPDESFFQTLAPVLAQGAVDARPLTLQRFDAEGRPVVFHDDHRGLLEGCDFFFARKIDPDAEGLYARFLRPGGAAGGEPGFRGTVDEAPFEAARDRARGEGIGVLSAARVPEGTGAARVETVAPYAVLVGHDPAALARLREALRAPGHEWVQDSGPVFHGRLFGPRPAAFAVPGEHYAGVLPGAPRLRDYRPAQFLARAIWADRGSRVAFLFVPGDSGLVAGQILGDPNARLVLCGDGAALLAALASAASMPVPRCAWARTADPADPARVGAALAADWTDPEGWDVPGEPRPEAQA